MVCATAEGPRCVASNSGGRLCAQADVPGPGKEHVIDKGDVEVELAGVLGLELARLELDNHIAR